MSTSFFSFLSIHPSIHSHNSCNIWFFVRNIRNFSFFKVWNHNSCFDDFIYFNLKILWFILVYYLFLAFWCGSYSEMMRGFGCGGDVIIMNWNNSSKWIVNRKWNLTRTTVKKSKIDKIWNSGQFSVQSCMS